jgi:hypothetical protein
LREELQTMHDTAAGSAILQAERLGNLCLIQASDEM